MPAVTGKVLSPKFAPLEITITLDNPNIVQDLYTLTARELPQQKRSINR